MDFKIELLTQKNGKNKNFKHSFLKKLAFNKCINNFFRSTFFNLKCTLKMKF